MGFFTMILVGLSCCVVIGVWRDWRESKKPHRRRTKMRPARHPMRQRNSAYDEITGLDSRGQLRRDVDKMFPDADEESKANIAYDLLNDDLDRFRHR